MDDRLTEQIQLFLAAAPQERDAAAGAMLLLRLNRNRVLYANIMRRPEKMLPKLEYELQKHLRIRLDGLTRHGVAVMEREVIPHADATLSTPPPGSGYRGKRADHNQLPQRLQALYERNGEVWRKLKQTRETLRQMEKAQPCDRYEYCKLLSQLDKEYHANWAAYDSYDATALAEQGEEENAETPADGELSTSATPAALPTAKQVSAARKYISLARRRWQKLSTEEERIALTEAMQERVNTILLSGGSFAQEVIEELEKQGVSFKN